MENNQEKELKNVKQKKNKKVFLLLALIILLGIGYAYLQTVLNISGTATVKGNTWRVYWDNVLVTDGSVSGEQVTTAPTIDPENDTTEVTFSISLLQPGEFYEFTIDAVNNGTVDAMISNIETTISGNNYPLNYLDVSVTYDDGLALAEKQVLPAKGENYPTIEKYKVRVEYKKNIDATELPGDDETLTIEFEVLYEQADNTASIINNRIYNVSNTSFPFGEPVPAVDTYNSYNEAIPYRPTTGAATDVQAFLRHTLLNNNIKDTYVGFIYNDKLYYLQGGGATYNTENNEYNHDSIYFDHNLQVLKQAFDLETECKRETTGDFIGYTCFNEQYGAAHADNIGQIAAINTDYSGCGVFIGQDETDNHQFYYTMCDVFPDDGD